MKINKHENILFLTIIVLAAFFVGVAINYVENKDSQYIKNSDLSIIPNAFDSGGVYGADGFTVYSNLDNELSVSEFQQNLSITPSLKYVIHKDNENFVIIPKEKIIEGSVYKFKYQVEKKESYEFSFKMQEKFEIVSATPINTAGVTLNESLRIKFSNGTLDDPNSSVIISPKVNGTWKKLNNEVIFTPSQWQSGTLYTVNVAKGSQISNGARGLKENYQFSFETQNPNNRVPVDKLFHMDQYNYNFTKSQLASFQLSAYDKNNGIANVDVEVIKYDDQESFVNAVNDYVCVPSWAKETKSHMKVSTKNSTTVEKLNGSLVDVDGKTYYQHYRSLSDGYYLFKFIWNDHTIYAPAVVSDLSCLGFIDDDTVYIKYSGQSVDYMDIVHPTVKDGYVPIGLGAYPYVKLNNNGQNSIYFLDNFPDKNVYVGKIHTDKINYAENERISVIGFVNYGTDYKKGLNDDYINVSIASDSSDFHVEKLKLNDDGYFQFRLNHEYLPKGEYNIKLSYKGKVLDNQVVSVGQGDDSGVKLVVSANKYSFITGGICKLNISLKSDRGVPLSNHDVYINGNIKVTTNEDGIAIYEEQQSVATGQPLTIKVYNVIAELYDGMVVSDNCMIQLGKKITNNTASSIAASGVVDGHQVKINASVEKSIIKAELYRGFGMINNNTTPYDSKVAYCDDSIDLSLSKNGVIGPYYVCLSAIDKDGSVLASKIIQFNNNEDYVSYDNVAKDYSNDSNIELKFNLSSHSKNGREIQYKLNLNGNNGYSKTVERKGYVGLDFVENVGKLDAGKYQLKLEIYSGKSLVYNNEYIFRVDKKSEGYKNYEIAPLDISNMLDSYSDSYVVNSDKAVYLSNLLEYQSLPGDHISQLITKDIIAQLLKEDVSISYLAYQKSWGGISTEIGYESNLLLCSLIANYADGPYNREALISYFRDKMVSSDRQWQILSIWGLSAFKEDILLDAQQWATDTSLTEREKVYIGLALCNLGDKERAKLLFDDLKKVMISDGDTLYLPDKSNKDNLGLTMLAYIYAHELNMPEMSKLLNYSLAQDDVLMVDRAIWAVIQYIAIGDNKVYDLSKSNSIKTDDDISIVSLKQIEDLPYSGIIENYNVKAARVGNVVTVDISLLNHYKSNHLYIVQYKIPEGFEVYPTYQKYVKDGYLCITTRKKDVSIPLLPQTPGIYQLHNAKVFDLTYGKCIGTANEKSVMVIE